MSAIPHLQHHMTSAHGHSVPSNLSHSTGNAVSQSSNKRPKLSLQTTSLTSTYGSLTRGIAPNTSQAIYTPTTANTLSNTWDLSIRPSPISRTDSPRPLHQVRSQAGQQPYAYSLPFGVKPILKNSPLPPRAASVSASPRESRRKVFFPQPKRVLFKQDLEEIIETKQYVAKHSDLPSSEEEVSDDDTQVESASLTKPEIATSAYHNSPPPNRKRKVRRDSGISVDSATESPASASTTSTTNESDTIDDTTSIENSTSCKRRKRQPSSSKSFGGHLEKEGIALLRGNCQKDTDSSENTTNPLNATPEPRPSPHTTTSDDNDDTEEHQENCEARSGEEKQEGRADVTSPLPPISQGMPDSSDYGISLPFETERDMEEKGVDNNDAEK